MFQPSHHWAIPEAHREQLARGLRYIDQGAKLLGEVRHAYPAHDPLYAEIRELLLRCDLTLMLGELLLSRHPARKG